MDDTSKDSLCKLEITDCNDTRPLITQENTITEEYMDSIELSIETDKIGSVTKNKDTTTIQENNSEVVGTVVNTITPPLLNIDLDLDTNTVLVTADETDPDPNLIDHLTFSMIDDISEQSISYKCPICFEQNRENITFICEHQFCIKCVKKMQMYEHHKCPICRGPCIDKNDIIPPASTKMTDEELVSYREARIIAIQQTLTTYEHSRDIRQINPQYFIEERRRQDEVNLSRCQAGCFVCCFIGLVLNITNGMVGV